MTTKLAFCVLSMCAFAAPVGTAETVTATASVRIVTPLTVSKLAALDFGTLHAGARDGDVVISPSGSIATHGGVGIAADVAPHPARFAINGDPNRDYRINLPVQAIASGMRDAADVLVADEFSARSMNVGGVTAMGRLDTHGADEITVGARVVVPASARADHYTVDVPITVDYY